MWDKIKSVIENIAGWLFTIVFIWIPLVAFVLMPFIVIFSILPFDEISSFIDKYSLSFIIPALVCALCIAITVLINRHLKKKYKQKELSLTRQNEKDRKQFEQEQETLQKIKSSLIVNQEMLAAEREHFEEIKLTECQTFFRQSILYDYFKNTLTIRHIDTHGCMYYNRLYYFLRDEHKKVKHQIKKFTLTAEIQGREKEPYHTTLDGCNCYDFNNTLHRKEPCKHMYMLAYELALLNELPIEAIKTELGLPATEHLKTKKK